MMIPMSTGHQEKHQMVPNQRQNFKNETANSERSIVKVRRQNSGNPRFSFSMSLKYFTVPTFSSIVASSSQTIMPC